MDFVFKCPHCEQSLQVDTSGVGSEIVCPSCNHVLVVPPPGPKSARGAEPAAAKPDRPLSLAGVAKGSEGLIQKPSRPLEVAAKVGDKRFHVKTIRRADCVLDGQDTFDAAVTQFLETLPGLDVVSVTPVSYSHFPAPSSQAVLDYGVLIVYRA